MKFSENLGEFESFDLKNVTEEYGDLFECNVPVDSILLGEDLHQQSINLRCIN